MPCEPAGFRSAARPDGHRDLAGRRGTANGREFHDMPDESATSPQSDPRAYQSAARDDATTPKNLKVQLKEQRLIVDWKDGKRSEFSLDALRRECPCATCRSERDHAKQNPLRILKADPTGVRVENAELVGSYAIQFHWSDGHNTGIFDFRYLRSLDPGAA